SGLDRTDAGHRGGGKFAAERLAPERHAVFVDQGRRRWPVSVEEVSGHSLSLPGAADEPAAMVAPGVAVRESVVDLAIAIAEQIRLLDRAIVIHGRRQVCGA